MEKVATITNSSPIGYMKIADHIRRRLEAKSDRDLLRVVETYNGWFGHSEGSSGYLSPFKARVHVIDDILNTKPFAMPDGLLEFASKFI